MAEDVQTVKGAPVPVAARVLPSARELRACIPPEVRSTSWYRALSTVSLCLLSLAAGLLLVAWPREGWGLRACGTVLLGITGARCFESCAHEALHFHFTGSRRLDRIIAHALLLPTLKPLGPTIYGHVHRHHRYTNIKGYDMQWSPKSLAEYRALSPARRLLERVYRSAPGIGVYWSIEVVLRYFTPRGMRLSEAIKPPDVERGSFTRDRWLVYAYIAAHLASWPALAPTLGISAPVALLYGFLGPLLIAHWLVGFGTYLQHTSEEIAWFESPAAWSFYHAQLAGTAHLLPQRQLVGALLGLDNPHTAHHVDMNVPGYALAQAQRALNAAHPGVAPRRIMSLQTLMRTTARCKVYDFEAHRWLDFSGRPTSEPYFRARAPNASDPRTACSPDTRSADGLRPSPRG